MSIHWEVHINYCSGDLHIGLSIAVLASRWSASLSPFVSSLLCSPPERKAHVLSTEVFGFAKGAFKRNLSEQTNLSSVRQCGQMVFGWGWSTSRTARVSECPVCRQMDEDRGSSSSRRAPQYGITVAYMPPSVPNWAARRRNIPGRLASLVIAGSSTGALGAQLWAATLLRSFSSFLRFHTVTLVNIHISKWIQSRRSPIRGGDQWLRPRHLPAAFAGSTSCRHGEGTKAPLVSNEAFAGFGLCKSGLLDDSAGLQRLCISQQLTMQDGSQTLNTVLTTLTAVATSTSWAAPVFSRVFSCFVVFASRAHLGACVFNVTPFAGRCSSWYVIPGVFVVHACLFLPAGSWVRCVCDFVIPCLFRWSTLSILGAGAGKANPPPAWLVTNLRR